MKKLFFALFVTVVIFVVVICVKDKPVVPIEEHNETAVSDSTVTDDVEITEFLHQGDSETLTKAPRSQACFPITFFCNSQTVTVNEPVFTGIPTDTVLSYKKHYAFQDGATVFEVMTSDGTHKYFLVNREGEILDRDYPSSSNVSDIASLCRYEGVEKVQEGESWNYQQKLVSTDGEILSETFDFIGYFYNSIAIVEQDGKIGFIDSRGNTLVRPCIQYDDLRYPPDYKGFWLYHIQEDAFVLPIDGEFAIITLTREGEVAPVREVSIEFPEDFWASYLFDLETEKLTKLEDYAFNALISPDLKHLVYTGNFGGQWGYDCGVNNPQGYYIKEIESGKTWFYEHDVGYYEFKGWVNKAKLEEIR